MCDGLPDCPLLDEEKFCNLNKLICHERCICRLYAVSCDNTTSSHWESIRSELPYILLAFQNTIFSRNMFPNGIIDNLQGIQSLYIINCDLTTIKVTIRKPHNKLKTIDFSRNAISKMLQKSFRHLPNLTFLSLSSNKLRYIECGAFSNEHPFKLRVLNLSQNQLTYLKSCTFSGIQNADILDISFNFITTIDRISLTILDVKKIVTTSHITCCFLSKKLDCNITVPWAFSCSSMLANQFIRTTIWMVAVLGCTCNLLSLFKQIHNVNNCINPEFSTSVYSVALSDFCHCFSLLLVAIFDAKYGTDFIAHKYEWRKSILCRMIAFLFLFSSFLSIYGLNILAISRYDIVRLPILSKFKDRLFCLQMQMSGFFKSIFVSTLFLTLHLNNDGQWQLQTSLCFIAGNLNGGLVQTLVTITLIIAQFLSCFNIVTLYFLLVRKVKSVEYIQTNRKSKDKVILGTVITTCISTILCWIPSSCVYTASLLAPNYSYRLLVWTVVSILSINALVDPAILNLEVFKQIIACPLKSKSESDKERTMTSNITTILKVPQILKYPMFSTLPIQSMPKETHI